MSVILHDHSKFDKFENKHNVYENAEELEKIGVQLITQTNLTTCLDDFKTKKLLAYSASEDNPVKRLLLLSDGSLHVYKADVLVNHFSPEYQVKLPEGYNALHAFMEETPKRTSILDPKRDLNFIVLLNSSTSDTLFSLNLTSKS